MLCRHSNAFLMICFPFPLQPSPPFHLLKGGKYFPTRYNLDSDSMSASLTHQPSPYCFLPNDIVRKKSNPSKYK